jgi:hypothetical protein
MGYPGLSKGPVLTHIHALSCELTLPTQAETRCCHCATWLVARDVSQRVEPDVRPLGRAVSAFIAERTRRLSTLLTGDVPPQHLLWPVHSAGRRRPDHPAGGVPVQSIAKQYARAARCTVAIITYVLPGKLPLHANTTQIADVMVQEDCSKQLQVLHPF